MNQVSRNIALWLVVALMFLLLFNFFSRTQQRSPEIIFSDFLNNVQKGEVASVTIQGNIISGDTSSGEDPARQGRQNRRASGRGRSVVDGIARPMVPDAAPGRRLDLLHAPDADWRRQGDVLR
jgi:hypothetical protein